MSRRLVTQTQQRARQSSLPTSGLLQRKCACGEHTVAGGECAECRRKRRAELSTAVQPKLTVNAPGDKYEHEADRVAEQVMRTPGAEPTFGSEVSGSIRQNGEPGASLVEGETAQQIESLREGGRPLSSSTRSFFESRFGRDFGDVRVHVSNRADEAARSLNAKAFTTGQDVVFRSGSYRPSTEAGKQLVAHELAHVVQQGGVSKRAKTTYVQRQRGDNENREGLSNRGGARPSASLKRTKSGVQKRSWFDASPSQEHIASIYFPTDSFSLDGNDIQVLKKIRDDIETKLLGHDVTVEILGFADERGSRRHNKELSQARADAVKITLDSLLPSASHRSNNLKIPDPEGRGEAEKPQEGTTAEELSEYRRVDIKVSPPTPAQPEVVPAPSCSCDGGWPYSNVAIAFVTDIAPMIKKLASSSPAPAYAVAGAIADEHEAQQRYFGLLDAVQNRALDWGLVPSGEPEYEEGTGEEKEKESEGGRIEKFANALENDIGPANIKVRTAVRHAMERRIGTTAKPPSDVDVGHIVDQLLTVRGTVQTAVWVIEKAHTLFGPYIKNYPQPLAEAVYVSYFKQGKREYYEDFQEKLDFDPSHRPCPGTAGCRYKENREQITKALGAE